jgi:C4-dicarboxylate-binding protein DctP
MRRCLLTLLFALGALSAVEAAEPILIRFSHVVGEDTPKGVGAALLQRLVAERLGGRVAVEVYPRSRKFNDDQALLALVFGDIELAAPSFSKFRAFSKQIQVFDLPFLLPGAEAVHRFQESETGQGLLASMTSQGLQGLAYWDNGMRAMSANKPLRRPEDIAGLRFRIEPSRVMEAQYQALDVATVPLPFKYVAEALKMGLVDGQENAWSNIYAQGFQDYQQYFTDVGHSFLGYMLVTNAEFWSQLPSDIRAALEAIIAEVTAEVNRLASERSLSDRERIIALGKSEVIMLSDAERAAWRERMLPVWQEFEPQIGKEVIEAALAAGRAQ